MSRRNKFSSVLADFYAQDTWKEKRKVKRKK